MILRAAGPEDAAALAGVFWRAVQEGAAGKYSEAERRAWLPDPLSADQMAQRLLGLWTIVAEPEPEPGQAGRSGPVGFMSLRSGGYLDLAFVLPEVMGQGVAARLLAAIEAEGRRRQIGRLTCDASRLMRPFLLRHGWESGPETPVQRNNQRIARWPMWVVLGEE